MPPLTLVSQQLQRLYLQDMHRSLSSGQNSVWQRGKEEARYLPLVLEELQEGLALLPSYEDRPVSQTVGLSVAMDCLAPAISHPHPPHFPSEVPTKKQKIKKQKKITEWKGHQGKRRERAK